MARIAAATGLAIQHQQETIEEILGLQNKTLGPTGLVVESLDSAFEEVEEPETKEVVTGTLSLAESVSSISEPITEEDYLTVDVVPSSGSHESEQTYQSTQQGPTKEEEAELRRTVQALFELEEALLNQHMSNIQVSYLVPSERHTVTHDRFF
jgi:hypothetical protein